MNERVEMPADVEALVPAVDLTIITTVAGDRQIQMRTAFLQETSETDANMVMDKLSRMADRQRAIYELPAIQAELETHEKTLARFREDLTRIMCEHGRRMVGFDREIMEAKKASSDAYDQAASAYAMSGRRGAFTPTGHVKSALAGKAAEVLRIEGEKAKADAEHKQWVSQQDISIARYVEEIAARQAKIAERRKLIGGEG